MKKTVKIIVITGTILFLLKLFLMPITNPLILSDSAMEAREDGALVNEYRIISIDTLQSGYNFPINEVWTQKYLHRERNKLGIVVIRTAYPEETFARFSLIENDTFFTFDNIYFKSKWGISDEQKSMPLFNGRNYCIEFPYSSEDTVSYFINKKEEKERTPLFHFKVVAIKE